jgi:drug/metabolite transporter (DMT)-like permease
MKATQVIGAALLVIGVILLFFGYQAATSPMEEIGEAIFGRYSDETMLYLIGGAVSAVVGLVLILKR